RLAELGEQSAAEVPVGDKLEGAAEKVDRGSDVGARAGGLRCGREPRCGAVAKRRIGCIELRAVTVGLLEVVAEDLVGCVVAEPCRQPVGVALVQRSSLTFRNRLVGRISDQDVAEAEAVVAGHGCATKSGFPSAAATICVRVSSDSSPSASTSASLSVSARGSSVTMVAFGFGAVHVGRSSNRSGRAVQRKKSGTSCANVETYSTR